MFQTPVIEGRMIKCLRLDGAKFVVKFLQRIKEMFKCCTY